MRDVIRKDDGGKITPERSVAIDHILLEGIKGGPMAKRRAINKVLREIPEFTRSDCWQRIRYLRKVPKVP